MSFTHQLLPELPSLVFSFLTPQHLLSTCSHVSHAVTRTALTPPCFRTRLLLHDRAINALPTVSLAAFILLTQATALDVKYGKGAAVMNCRALFSPDSRRSLLHFTHIRSLKIRMVAPLDCLTLSHRPPLALLSDLILNSAGREGGGGDAGGQLPHLTRLTIGCVCYAVHSPALATISLAPLSTLPSLTHLRLLDNGLTTSQLQQLLALHGLQVLTHRRLAHGFDLLEHVTV